jgi:hypothetical protein
MTIPYQLAKAYQEQLLEAAERDLAAELGKPQAGEALLERLRACLNLRPTAYAQRRPARDARTTA